MITDRPGRPAVATCDGCGAQGDCVEVRNPATGALQWAALPDQWTVRRVVGGADQHRCGGCSGSVSSKGLAR